MQGKDYYFIIPIALLYGVFFSHLVNVVRGYKDLNRYNSVYQIQNQANRNKEQEDWEKRQEQIKKQDSEKYNIMMVIGLIGIITGVMMHKRKDIQIAGAGIAAGGVLTMIYYILYNWVNMDDKNRLFVSGSVLVALIYASFSIFK